MDLFKELLPSLNLKDTHLIDENPERESKYDPFIVNRNFSFGLDSLLFANEMNKYPELDKKLQYDFYFHGLDKRKRFNKWIKKEMKDEEILDALAQFHDVSRRIAKEYKKLYSPEELQLILERINKGNEFTKS